MKVSASVLCRMGRSRSLLLALLLLAGLGQSMRTAGAQEPKMPDFPIIFPYADYPDEQVMAQVSGNLTAIFRAHGDYSFPRGDGVGTVERCSLELTMTLQYRLSPKSKEAVITRIIQGVKKDTMESRCSRDVTTDTYSGSSSLTCPKVNVRWSKERKLACFDFPGEVAFEFEPGNIHREEDYKQWCIEPADNRHETRDLKGAACGFFFPSHSIAPSRYAQYLNAHPGWELMGCWIEGPSAKGATSGSYSLPMIFDGTAWRPAGTSQDPSKQPGCPAQIIWPGSLEVVWALGDNLPEGKMTIAAGDPDAYGKWVPAPIDDDLFEPASALSFHASILPKEEGQPAPKGKIDFWLRNVSQEPGQCANFPKGGGKDDDLRFTPGQADLNIDPQNPRHATTKEAVADFTVQVEALDTGAYGTLQATCDELGLIAEDERTQLPSIAIPMDDNRNHVADAWEKENGIEGEDLPADWDEETVEGQDAKGDGITLYNEYRGLVVLVGKNHTFQRLLPKQKEMFILDPDGAFPGALWKDRTCVEITRLDESLADPAGNTDGGPLVNFNASDRAAHPFYALRVQTIKDDTDVDPATDDNGKKMPSSTSDPSTPRMAYSFSAGSVRSADYIKVFPFRARLMVDYYMEWLSMGLKSPDSVPGQELRDPKNLFSVDEALQAWGLLGTPAAQGALAQKILAVLFIHEVGHICGGLPDHEGDPPQQCRDEARACFMWNPTLWDRRRMIVLSALGRGDPNYAYSYQNFCHDLPEKGFHCYRSLKIKDW